MLGRENRCREAEIDAEKRKLMPGRGDECAAQAIESEIDAQKLVDRERLQGLARRLAAGDVSMQDWISLATQNGEQGQPAPQWDEGEAEREENRGA